MEILDFLYNAVLLWLNIFQVQLRICHVPSNSVSICHSHSCFIEMKFLKVFGTELVSSFNPVYPQIVGCLPFSVSESYNELPG